MGAASVRAQSFSEGFNDITVLTGLDWVLENQSELLGPQSWNQGDTMQFTAQAGPGNSYISANFNSAGNGAGPDRISNWLISPARTFNNGDQISFYTRTISPVQFADRLQVRLNKNNSGTNNGTSSTDVGDFNTLLTDINPLYLTSGVGSYPTTWTQFTLTLSGLGGPTPGRFAFRYFVENGGPGGARSNYIGIDSVTYTQVPEPGTFVLLALAGVVIGRRRRAGR